MASPSHHPSCQLTRNHLAHHQHSRKELPSLWYPGCRQYRSAYPDTRTGSPRYAPLLCWRDRFEWSQWNRRNRPRCCPRGSPSERLQSMFGRSERPLPLPSSLSLQHAQSHEPLIQTVGPRRRRRPPFQDRRPLRCRPLRCRPLKSRRPCLEIALQSIVQSKQPSVATSLLALQM